jgi:hypothetical protein
MHRSQSLASPTFHLIEILACATAGLALLVSLVALARLWITGAQGWGLALIGLMLSVLCLAPFAYNAWLFTRYPALTDVATTFYADLPDALGRHPPELDAAVQGQIAKVFPNVHPRTYLIDTRRVFAIVSGLAVAQGWQLQTQHEPVTEQDEGTIDATETTLLGWRDEIMLRVAGDTRSASVDMRSLSLGPTISDLGANGRRIEDFLVGLDSEVTRLLRDDPAGLAALDPNAPGSLDASGAPIPAPPLER